MTQILMATQIRQTIVFLKKRVMINKYITTIYTFLVFLKKFIVGNKMGI